MDPERLFAAAPPREPLDSLEAIVRDWQWRFIEGDASQHRDQVAVWCREANNLHSAIIRAALSQDKRGKLHPHQRRCPQMYEMLPIYAAQLLRVRDRIQACSAFDELHSLCLEHRPHQVGIVTAYDTAVRIDTFMGLEPQDLHLHSGVMEGWLELVPDWDPKVTVVAREVWPKALQALPADQVEDLLCCYRRVLRRLQR